MRDGHVARQSGCMRSFLLRHRHAPHECAAAYAAWKGFESPLRHHPTISSCVEGGHEIWWRIDAIDRHEALALLPHSSPAAPSPPRFAWCLSREAVMNKLAPTLALSLCAALGAPAAASAETFCVNLPTCTGTDVSTPQEALDIAAFNNQADTVRIGAKATPYAGGLSYVDPERVTIIGAGRDQTVIQSTLSDPAIVDGNSTSRVEDLEITIRQRRPAGLPARGHRGGRARPRNGHKQRHLRAAPARRRFVPRGPR